MRLLVLAVVLTCTTAIAAPAIAHPGHDHKVMGVITAIHGDHVTMKTSDGHERSFQIVPTTKLLRGKKKGTAAELKIGMRLVVNVGSGEEPLKAKEIQYSDASAPRTDR